MESRNLLTRRRTFRTAVLLVMMLLASLTGLTGATPDRRTSTITSMASASSLAQTNTQGISTSATSPGQEQKQRQAQSQQLEPGQLTTQPATPLERMLNKDGTLKLSTDFSGSVSVDPKGWRMQIEPDGQPHFLRVSTNEQSITQSSKLKTQNLLAPLVPGDEYWDDRFGALGMDGPYVLAIAITGTDVYVGGSFGTAGGVSAYGIAKWDDNSWSALGSGGDAQASAIAISGTDVYVGGLYFGAEGVPDTTIAKWNGSTWSALGSGVGHPGRDHVYAIAINGSDVYVGGSFSTAGGVPASGIAKWDGNSWSALGSGVNNGVNDQVSAIKISGSDVYVGGGFNTAGGVPASAIARWDGSMWSALGSGLTGGAFPRPYVNEIAISGTNVYAGGNFTTAGGLAANYIARWDGSSWSALGSGMGGTSPYVKTIDISGSDVYAAGFFTTAGGVSAYGIAKWDGSTWSTLGSGVSGSSSPGVWGIATNGSEVYVGGQFTTAGINPSYDFGIWHIPPAVNMVGHVTWAGSTQPDNRQMQPLTLTLCSTTGGPTHTYPATTNASGYFTINVASLITSTTGTYNWWEKGTRSLANSGTLTLTGGNQQEEMGVQRGGDADNDNVVGVLDFQILRTTFNSTTDLRADFNNDGVTGAQDFAILKGTFGQAGAPVSCP